MVKPALALNEPATIENVAPEKAVVKLSVTCTLLRVVEPKFCTVTRYRTSKVPLLLFLTNSMAFAAPIALVKRVTVALAERILVGANELAVGVNTSASLVMGVVMLQLHMEFATTVACTDAFSSGSFNPSTQLLSTAPSPETAHESTRPTAFSDLTGIRLEPTFKDATATRFWSQSRTSSVFRTEFPKVATCTSTHCASPPSSNAIHADTKRPESVTEKASCPSMTKPTDFSGL